MFLFGHHLSKLITRVKNHSNGSWARYIQCITLSRQPLVMPLLGPDKVKMLNSLPHRQVSIACAFLSVAVRHPRSPLCACPLVTLRSMLKDVAAEMPRPAASYNAGIHCGR